MKHIYLIFSAFLIISNSSFAQTVYDNETLATTLNFQYFGSTLDGQQTTTIDNPDATGVNTSSKVLKYIKAANSETWAGGFANPAPLVPIDGTNGGTICVKVWMDHEGVVGLKLEGATNGGENWITTQPFTTANAWQEVCFDLASPSIEDSELPGVGNVYSQIVLFFDFDSNSTTDETYYFDDITIPSGAGVISTTIYDFETAETSGEFSYFGSSLEGTNTTVIANPNPSGINTSATVGALVKPVGAQTWAGAYSNPNPTIPVNVTNGGQICVKVHMDHIGNFALKLEGAVDGGPNWIQVLPNTKVNEWEELCFDVTQPSLEAPETSANTIYQTVTIFFDFLNAPGANDATYYFDDIIVKSGGLPTAKTVTFKVDMNSYSANFNQVYVSGTFNDWSGESNPLSDDDLDGIWEGNISLLNGAYEYKISLDNWTQQEILPVTSECTKSINGGEFVNRVLLVGADVNVPQFCFGSCYACGEEVNVTFRLGMGDVVPSPDGVWLAGGGNFDVPGGRYKMNDTDGDNVYEVVVPRKAGFSSYYAFANGPCGDYSCKEDLTGQSCGDANNFNDRFLPAITSNTTVATCFGSCADNVECVSSTKSYTASKEMFTLVGNPTSNGILTLNFSSQVKSDKKVKVLDNLGAQIESYQINTLDRFDVNTSALPSGIYFIQVTSGFEVQTQKFINIQ